MKLYSNHLSSPLRSVAESRVSGGGVRGGSHKSNGAVIYDVKGTLNKNLTDGRLLKQAPLNL